MGISETGGVGGGGAGGGGGGSINVAIGAQAFLRRRDAVADTEGVLAYFGPVAAGEEAIAGLGPVGNDWSVRSRQRDPGLSAIAAIPDGTTFASRAFLSSDLNQTDFVLRGFDPAITSARWNGTLATRQSAGEGTVVAGEILFYYWEQAQTSGARTIYAISTDADYLFNSVILWQGYTNNNYRGFLRENVKWVHDVTFDNNLAGEGRFANDAAALAYIVENKAYFQGVLTDVIVLGATTLELAYFRTSDDTVRIGTVTFGADEVEGIPGEPTEPLEVILHEDDQTIELRYANQANALSPVTRADNIGEIVAAFNLHNDRGLYAVAAGSAADAAAFTRDPGFLLEPEGLVSTFLPRRDAEDTEGVDVWLYPVGSSYLNTNSPIAAGQTIRVFSGVGDTTPLPGVTSVTINTVLVALRMRYDPATATITQILAALNAHNASGLNAAAREGTNAGSDFNRVQPWSHDFAFSDFAPDAWEVPFALGATVTLESAFYALGPEQNVFMGNTEAAAQAARNAYAAANVSWRAAYQSDQRLFVLLRWGAGGNEQATVLLADGVTWRDIDYVFVGKQGPIGIPGGGAIERIGDILDGTPARPANEFIATGIMLGARGATPYLLYRINPNTLTLLWFSTSALYDIERAAAGDTSTDGTTTTPRNRARLPESAGSSISGSVDAGLTAAGELLISTTTANVDITVEFFRYVPSLQQDVGLSDADRAELTRLSGVETDATRDQTAGEIAILLDGLIGDATDAAGTLLGTLSQFTYDEDDNTLTFVPNPPNLQFVRTPDTLIISGANVLGGPFGAAAVIPVADSTGLGVMSAAQASKLAGIAPAANRLVPYKIGNIYRAFAVGDVVVKPANNEGTVTAAGITDAPVGWRLTRPETTAALPYVYDCHVYGYDTNGVFGVQYGTPNRTDRYNPFTAALLAKLTAIEAGATADLTGSEIIAIINAALGSMQWQIGGTGGADTAAQILTKLLTVDGAGSLLDADFLDGMTPAEVAALASFNLHDDVSTSIPSLSSSDRFLVSDENVADDPNRYVTLTRLQNAIASVPFLTNVRGLTTTAAVNTLIQTALAAAVTGNTETGITVTHNDDGTIDFVVTGGGGTPGPTDDIYFGTSANDTPDPNELILAAVNGVATIEAYAGNRHVLIARLATEADITVVRRSDDQSGTNQIGAFSQFANTVIPMGETLQFNVWVSNQALTQDANVEWMVR